MSERDSLRLIVSSNRSFGTRDSAATTTVIAALTRLAWMEFNSHPAASLGYARKAVEAACTLKNTSGTTSGNMRLLANAFTVVAANYRLTDRYDSAIDASTQALALYSQLRDTNASSDALANLGGVYQSRGEYARAFEHFSKALALYEQTRNEHGIAQTAANIGAVYFLVGQFAAADRYLQRALETHRRWGNSAEVAYSLYRLGNLAQAERRYTEANGFYAQALRLFDSMNVVHGIALTLGELGRLQFAERRFPEARTTLLNGLLRFMDIGDRRNTARVLNALAETCLHLNKPDEARTDAVQALDLSTAIGAKREERDACLMLAKAHEILHHDQQALQFLHRAMLLNDTLFSTESAERIATVELRHATDQKNAEIRALTFQQQANKAEARSTRNSLLWGMAGLICALAAALQAYRIKRRSEASLRQTNAQILSQQRKLEAQSQEIARTNTELAAANDRLAAQNLDLTRLNDEKNEFLGIAAHDLRNPIANIMTLSDFLHEDLSIFTNARTEDERNNTSDAMTRNLNLIQQSSSKMLRLLENLLDVNAIERGVVPLTHERFDAVTTLQPLLDEYRMKAEQKQISLYAELPAHVWLVADKQAFTQVLDNLLSNAVKYSPHGKNIYVRLKSEGENMKQMEERMRSEGGNMRQDTVQSSSLSPLSVALNISSILRVEVQDEGPGISPEDMKKLFGKFARLTARPTGGEHSTGLGLSIVKKMVEAMNGRVWCESEASDGRPTGATFIVELPQTVSARNVDH